MKSPERFLLYHWTSRPDATRWTHYWLFQIRSHEDRAPGPLQCLNWVMSQEAFPKESGITFHNPPAIEFESFDQSRHNGLVLVRQSGGLDV